MTDLGLCFAFAFCHGGKIWTSETNKLLLWKNIKRVFFEAEVERRSWACSKLAKFLVLESQVVGMRLWSVSWGKVPVLTALWWLRCSSVSQDEKPKSLVNTRPRAAPLKKKKVTVPVPWSMICAIRYREPFVLASGFSQDCCLCTYTSRRGQGCSACLGWHPVVCRCSSPRVGRCACHVSATTSGYFLPGDLSDTV